MRERKELKHYGEYDQCEWIEYESVPQRQIQRRSRSNIRRSLPCLVSQISKRTRYANRSVLARDSKYCLVGEAWGYTGKQAGYYLAPLIPLVGCWSCVKYGQKFGKVAKKDDYAGSDFEPLISEFLAHWNRVHQGITREIKR